MSGQRIVEAIALEFDLEPVMAREIFLATIAQIETISQETGSCRIRGFGVFRLDVLKERVIHDYQSKSLVLLPAKKQLTFKQGRDRKKKLNPAGRTPSKKLSTNSGDKPCVSLA